MPDQKQKRQQNANIQTDAQATNTVATIEQRRSELAQLIGKLLANHWLRQQQQKPSAGANDRQDAAQQAVTD